jgi:hypothetical protein
MLNSGDAVRCTVHDGTMWMHLDNLSVKIPPQLLAKSQFLMDALSVADPSGKATLAAPKEWLQAWVGCYCNEEQILSGKEINDLVNCLLVCFLRLERSSFRDLNRYCFSNCVHSLSSARLDTSSLPGHVNLILFPLLLGSCERKLVSGRPHLQVYPRPRHER